MPLAPMPLLVSKDDCFVNVICTDDSPAYEKKKEKKRSSPNSPDSMLCSCGPKCQLLSTDAILPLCPSLLRPRPKAVHKPGLERDFIQLHPIPFGRGSNAERACLKKEI